MNFAVISGKGGAGKTTVATGLALALDDCGYIDMDAEEPNGHFFLHPDIAGISPVEQLLPLHHPDYCTYCGLCQDACHFNALTVLQGLKKVLIHQELCHHCGVCSYVCPETGAMTEVPVRVGQISRGVFSGNKIYLEARMDTGQSSAVPILRSISEHTQTGRDYILDASPGTSCTVVEVLELSDYVVLVGEPTPFGLSDLRLSLDLVREKKKPHGLVINKQEEGNNLGLEFARREGLELLGTIPYDRNIAEAYSRGKLYDAPPASLISSLKRIVNRLISAREVLALSRV